MPEFPGKMILKNEKDNRTRLPNLWQAHYKGYASGKQLKK